MRDGNVGVFDCVYHKFPLLEVVAVNEGLEVYDESLGVLLIECIANGVELGLVHKRVIFAFLVRRASCGLNHIILLTALRCTGAPGDEQRLEDAQDFGIGQFLFQH